jgi:hypothetical protein
MPLGDARWWQSLSKVCHAVGAADLSCRIQLQIANPFKQLTLDRVFFRFPKYFAIGTVVEGPGESKSNRLEKAQRRKATLTDQLLADSQVTQVSSSGHVHT